MREKITLATFKAIIDNLIEHAPDKKLENIVVDLQIKNGFFTANASAVTTLVNLKDDVVTLFGGTEVPGE